MDDESAPKETKLSNAIAVEWHIFEKIAGEEQPITRYPLDEPISMKALIEVTEVAKSSVNEILTHAIEKGGFPSLPDSILPRCPHGFPYTDVECAYSPSHWNVGGKHPNQAIAQYIQKMLQYPPTDLAEGIGGQLDVPYGDGENEKMDIYGDDVLPATAPVLGFVHGGYWQEGSRRLCTSMVENLNRQGVITAVIGYDLAPSAPLDKMVTEIAKATSYLNDWCTRRGTNALFLGGHSAGAHLIAQAVMSDSRNLDLVKGIFLISGVYDLIPLMGTYIERPLGLTPEAAKRLSPLHQMSKLPEPVRQVISEINIQIVVAEHDSPTFQEQSKRFFDHLATLNLLIDPGYHVVEGVDHFTLIESMDDPNSAFSKLLCRWMGLAVG